MTKREHDARRGREARNESAGRPQGQPRELDARRQPSAFGRLARDHQARVIVPHCPDCTKPCCNLDELVLELDWKRTQRLYQITKSRSAFDESLHDGTGPAHIRESDGTYYAHTKPCPAYVDKKCSVYGTDTKPLGCSDFPLYVDGEALTADRRCEAIDIDLVERELRDAGLDVERVVDPAFPMFVTFTKRRRAR